MEVEAAVVVCWGETWLGVPVNDKFNVLGKPSFDDVKAKVSVVSFSWASWKVTVSPEWHTCPADPHMFTE